MRAKKKKIKTDSSLHVCTSVSGQPMFFCNIHCPRIQIDSSVGNYKWGDYLIRKAKLTGTIACKALITQRIKILTERTKSGLRTQEEWRARQGSYLNHWEEWNQVKLWRDEAFQILVCVPPTLLFPLWFPPTYIPIKVFCAHCLRGKVWLYGMGRITKNPLSFVFQSQMP